MKKVRNNPFFLKRIASFVYPSYRFEWQEFDWLDDDMFNTYLKRFGEDISLNSHRRFTLAQLIRLVAHVEGDTAECGVFYGAGSYIMAKFASRFGKKHHAIDSYEGLSEPDESYDTMTWSKGNMAVSLEEVKRNLNNLPVEYHKGWIPAPFEGLEDKKFCFVHVDVDLYQPTKDSVEFFYERLSPGGIMLCDDYGFKTCKGATKAFDEFFKDKDEKMVALANGGGFLIKGVKTMPVSSL